MNWWVDAPSEGGSISGGVVKVTRELLFSRDGGSFFYVCLCVWYFRWVKSTVLIYFSLKITFHFRWLLYFVN